MIEHLFTDSIDLYEAESLQGAGGAFTKDYTFISTLPCSPPQHSSGREFTEGKKIGEEIYNIYVKSNNKIHNSSLFKYKEEDYEIIGQNVWHNIYLKLTIRKTDI